MPRLSTAEADISITSAACVPVEEPAPQGADGVVLTCTSEGFRVRFPGLVDFFLSADGRQIEVSARPGTPELTVRHLLIDHALLWALSVQGDLVLHASGIALPTGAALFLGPSGAGKSTIATALARRGCAALCDDGARLVMTAAGLSVAPSYPGFRLWPDGVAAILGAGQPVSEITHESSKRRWVPDNVSEAPVPLACVFFLDESTGAIEIAPLTRRAALAKTLDQAYRLPGGESAEVQGYLDRLTAFVTACPGFSLSHPYDFSRLDELADLIEATVAGLGNRTVVPGPATHDARASGAEISS